MGGTVSHTRVGRNSGFFVAIIVNEATSGLPRRGWAKHAVGCWDVLSLQHQLRASRADKVSAEKAAEERHVQCEKLQALVAEADERRDEQAEAAAGAVAEATALRRQLQAVRQKVDALHEEKMAQKDAFTLAQARAPSLTLSLLALSPTLSHPLRPSPTLSDPL